MKESIARALVASMLIALSGCISVHEREPDTVSTTTTTHRSSIVAPVPATTTVERTTVY